MKKSIIYTSSRAITLTKLEKDPNAKTPGAQLHSDVDHVSCKVV
jgi:hypothetical protein